MRKKNPFKEGPVSQTEMETLLKELNQAVPGALLNQAFDDTPRGRLARLHHELCEEARLLMEKKNHDYATEQDPFANFRMFGVLGVAVRMGDKLSRLTSFLQQGELSVEESLRDTVLDLINYSVIFLAMVHEIQPPEPKAKGLF